MCQIEYDKNVVYMSNTMPDRMPEYMSWNVIGGIIWSKVIPFYIVWYLFISWYIFLYFLSSFKVQFFLILNVFDFWTNKTMLYLTPCHLQHYLVLLSWCHFHGSPELHTRNACYCLLSVIGYTFALHSCVDLLVLPCSFLCPQGSVSTYILLSFLVAYTPQDDVYTACRSM